MQSLDSESIHTPSTMTSLFRGLIAGLIGIVALAIWAVNFEAIFNPNRNDTTIVLFLRILVCEAIPIATLVSIYASVFRGKTLEDLVFSILRTVFWFWKPRTSTMQDELDGFNQPPYPDA